MLKDSGLGFDPVGFTVHSPGPPIRGRVEGCNRPGTTRKELWMTVTEDLDLSGSLVLLVQLFPSHGRSSYLRMKICSLSRAVSRIQHV